MKLILFVAFSVLMGCTDDNPIFASSSNINRQLTIVPLQTTLNKGTSQVYQAYVVSSDGSQLNVTRDSVWSVDQTALAAISQSGLLETLEAGELTVSAQYQELVATANLIVTDKVITSFSVLPQEVITLAGLERQFLSFVEFDDGSNQDVTVDTQWTSSDPDIANFPGRPGNARAILAGLVTISAEFNSFSDTASLEVISGEPTEFLITPPVSYVPIGVNENYSASIALATTPVEYLDVTEQVVWSVDEPKLAFISNDIGLKGQATAKSEGVVIVSANLSFAGQSAVANAELNVIPIQLESIEVNPENITVVRGTDGQYVATGIFNDQQSRDITDTVVWSSSNDTVAKIETFGANSGRAVAINPGKTDITAALNGLSDTVTGTVVAPELNTLRVYPQNASIPLGESQPFSAFADYSDGTSQDVSNRVAWTSSNTTLATLNLRIPGRVDSDPTFAGLLPDTTDISASLGGVDSNIAVLTVTNATPTALRIVPGDSDLPLRVDANYEAMLDYSNQTTLNVTDQVVWSSSNQEIASISNSPSNEGRVHTVKTGTTVITAKYIDGTLDLSDFVNLDVTSDYVTFITPSCEPSDLLVGDFATCSCTANLSGGGKFDCTPFANFTPTPGGLALFGSDSSDRNIAEAIAAGNVNVYIEFSNSSGNASLRIE
ncbi:MULTISPECIES: Ig-like domain-containing protein [unclassified Oleiphilus]|nr:MULTISPECIES: Ig-like domain-containing protein [unclassified Oleiphilus]MCH2157896.1 Ig-like domain-containing protein [Oleiphilaceae bacterium]